jgi:hypothetical protein
VHNNIEPELDYAQEDKVVHLDKLFGLSVICVKTPHAKNAK